MHYDCGIAFVVPESVAKQALRLVEHIEGKQIPLTYKLGGGLVPHITLYQGRFKSEESAHEAWQKLTLPRSMSVTGLVILGQVEVRPNLNIFWNAMKTEKLRTLHEFVTRAMQPYTDGLLREESAAALRSADGEARARILSLGGVATGEYYYPHLTLGRLESAEHAPLLKGMDTVRSYLPEELCFGPIDQYGQMREHGLERRALA